MVNRRNYLLVKAYTAYLRDHMQLNASSVGRYGFYLRFLLIWADETPLSKAADIRQPSFAQFLLNTRFDGKDGPMAPCTIRKIIQTTKRFFIWARLNYPGDFRELTVAWINTLRPPMMAQRAKVHLFITLDEVLHLVRTPSPEGDLALRRDKAAAALLFLSGMRDGAFASLPIRAVDIPRRQVNQWPHEYGVRTKNGASATTFLLEISELLAVVGKWDVFIRSKMPPTAMWYTPVINHWGEQTLSPQPPGAHRHSSLAKRMRILFGMAGIPYKSPHKFRHGHAVYALQRAKTMGDYKAISQNLMHKDIRVTDAIYAPLLGNEIGSRIRSLSEDIVISDGTHRNLTRSLAGLSKKDRQRALVMLANSFSD
jgi:integrase